MQPKPYYQRQRLNLEKRLGQHELHDDRESHMERLGQFFDQRLDERERDGVWCGHGIDHAHVRRLTLGLAVQPRVVLLYAECQHCIVIVALGRALCQCLVLGFARAVRICQHSGQPLAQCQQACELERVAIAAGKPVDFSNIRVVADGQPVGGRIDECISELGCVDERNRGAICQPGADNIVVADNVPIGDSHALAHAAGLPRPLLEGR